jgi:hypothetical protein
MQEFSAAVQRPSCMNSAFPKYQLDRIDRCATLDARHDSKPVLERRAARSDQPQLRCWHSRLKDCQQQNWRRLELPASSYGTAGNRWNRPARYEAA